MCVCVCVCVFSFCWFDQLHQQIAIFDCQISLRLANHTNTHCVIGTEEEMISSTNVQFDCIRFVFLFDCNTSIFFAFPLFRSQKARQRTKLDHFALRLLRRRQQMADRNPSSDRPTDRPTVRPLTHSHASIEFKTRRSNNRITGRKLNLDPTNGPTQANAFYHSNSTLT